MMGFVLLMSLAENPNQHQIITLCHVGGKYKVIKALFHVLCGMSTWKMATHSLSRPAIVFTLLNTLQRAIELFWGTELGVWLRTSSFVSGYWLPFDNQSIAVPLLQKYIFGKLGMKKPSEQPLTFILITVLILSFICPQNDTSMYLLFLFIKFCQWPSFLFTNWISWIPYVMGFLRIAAVFPWLMTSSRAPLSHMTRCHVLSWLHPPCLALALTAPPPPDSRDGLCHGGR